MASIGHPVVGDVLYGAPREVKLAARGVIVLERNFLTRCLAVCPPKTGEVMSFERPLPPELQSL